MATQSLTVTIRCDTRLARAVVGASALATRLGWRPSRATRERIERFATGLIRVWVE